MADPRLLAATLADAVAEARTIAVGTNSPIPAAAVLLAQRRAGQGVTVSILGSARHNPFPDGGRELFDFAGQGRLDAFFLGGGQIDGDGNVNLVRAGEVRFPGSYGSAYLMALVPNIVLFREEHSPRVLVRRVEFISAAGRPRRLVTGRAVFGFEDGGFVLRSAHPGESEEGIRTETGFTFATDPGFGPTPEPSALDLEWLAGPIADDLAQTYPRFAQTLRGSHAPTA